MILIGIFVLHPLAEEIIERAGQVANNSVCFPADYFGVKSQIVGYTAIIQALILMSLVVISVFKPWNKKAVKCH